MVIGLATGFLLLAAILPPFGLRRDRDSFQCMTCLSKRDVFQWRIGAWSGLSLPLSVKRVSIVESKTFQRFTPLPHIHQWDYAQGSPYYWIDGFIGRTFRGCAIGDGRHRNNLAILVEEFPDLFHEDVLEEKLKSGELTTNQLYEALISPRFGTSSIPSVKLARQLADELQ